MANRENDKPAWSYELIFIDQTGSLTQQRTDARKIADELSLAAASVLKQANGISDPHDRVTAIDINLEQLRMNPDFVQKIVNYWLSRMLYISRQFDISQVDTILPPFLITIADAMPPELALALQTYNQTCLAVAQKIVPENWTALTPGLHRVPELNPFANAPKLSPTLSQLGQEELVNRCIRVLQQWGFSLPEVSFVENPQDYLSRPAILEDRSIQVQIGTARDFSPTYFVAMFLEEVVEALLKIEVKKRNPSNLDFDFVVPHTLKETVSNLAVAALFTMEGLKELGIENTEEIETIRQMYILHETRVAVFNLLLPIFERSLLNDLMHGIDVTTDTFLKRWTELKYQYIANSGTPNDIFFVLPYLLHSNLTVCAPVAYSQAAIVAFSTSANDRIQAALNLFSQAVELGDRVEIEIPMNRVTEILIGLLDQAQQIYQHQYSLQ